MLLGTLRASVLGNMLAGKGITRAAKGAQGKIIIRGSYGSKSDFYYSLIL